MPNYEQLLLQRLFQNESGWAQAVYLAGMFAMIIWRKESVVKWRLFRLSYLLFGASLVLPPIVVPFTQMLMNNRAGTDQHVVAAVVAVGLGPALLAGAVICGLSAMMPRLALLQNPAPPTKHPLD